MAKNIMIQGTMSNAGKSLLCAGLCRIFHQDGYKVAPFKSQNMALNSFITRDGLEMGRAQALQAQAAGVEPDVRMNPLLLKPTGDSGSQVILMGRVLGDYPAARYFTLKKNFWPQLLEAYDSLAAENDILVLEGAGSPAEINLKADDIVNMGLAARVNAPVLLVGDIDRGGVFAQLYGTLALLEEKERARVKGLLINKFRGDAALLDCARRFDKAELSALEGKLTRFLRGSAAAKKAVEGEHVPKGYGMGVEYTKEEIDAAFPDFYHVITPKNIVTQGAITIRTRDISGHGTAVAAIAAGNGRGSGGVYAGVAPQSEFIVVKLGNPMSGGFPRTTELMQGIDYVIRKAQELRMPVAVNISFGNTYGARDGTSLLERFIDDISNIWKSCICIGTGNEGATAGHTSWIVSENVRANREQEIELAVQEKQPSLNVQIWKRYVDQIDISIVSPTGTRIGPVKE